VSYDKIRDVFLKKLSAMQKCLYAKVTTSIPLSDSQIDRITIKLEQLFDKQIFVYNYVSSHFLAGILIQCGDKMIDLEARTAFNQLKNSLGVKRSYIHTRQRG
jgi:F0F1-type ATP synthase delta subunit